MVLATVGVLSAALFLLLAVVQHEVSAVYRSVGRTQALYVAEAGLDAAIDVLARDWMAYRDPQRFPLRDELAVDTQGQRTAVGAFAVSTEEVDSASLRVTATGRSLLGPAGFAAERTLTAVIVRKWRPQFQRGGGPGRLDLDVDHLDRDGVPDVVRLTGQLRLDHGHAQGTLSGGDEGARASGNHLLAGFTDVDLDGDLDLVLLDAPSRTTPQPTPHIGTIELTPAQDAARPYDLTEADLMGTGVPIPVVSRGWRWLPIGMLSGREDGADMFLQERVADGVALVSWTEVAP